MKKGVKVSLIIVGIVGLASAITIYVWSVMNPLPTESDVILPIEDVNFGGSVEQ